MAPALSRPRRAPRVGMNFFRNAFFQLATAVAGVPLALVTSIVLARYLSVADRGTLALLTAFAGMVAIVSLLGWPSASIYRLRSARSAPRKVAGTGLWATLVISLVVIAVCVAFRVQLTERFFQGVPPSLYYAMLLLVPFQLGGLIFSGVARGIDRFSVQNLYRVGHSAGNLAAAVLVLVLWSGALREILVALVIVQIVSTVWLVLNILRQTGLAWKVDMAETGASLRFGLKSYAVSLTGQIHERIDLFMLAFFLADPEEVAYYAVAYGVLQRVQLVPDAIGTALFPKLAGLDRREAGRFASHVSRHSVLWVALTVVLLGTAGPFLVPLVYGAQYLPSVRPFLILLPGVAAVTVYRILARYFLALGRQEINVATQVVSAIVNVLLNTWLIPRHGIVGAAIASLISYSLEALLITIAFIRVSGRRVGETFVFRRGDLRPYVERYARLKTRLVKSLRRTRDAGSDE